MSDADKDEPKIHNADVPSETAGLPEMGDGASARHYLRDVDTKNSEADTDMPPMASEVDTGQGSGASHGKPTEKG